MTEKDLDTAIEKCERIMEFDTRTLKNPDSENGYIFEKVYDLLKFLRQFEFETGGMDDTISRQAAIDATWFEPSYTDPLNVLTEVRDRLKALPSAQPERTCVNCGRTANNGGWYADGRTRCPIEEHYALPKDGYCHLWEKRNVTDDDYPEPYMEERTEE